MCMMVFIHHHLWVDPSIAGHHTMPDHWTATGKVYCQRGAESEKVCGSGVLKRGYLSLDSVEDHNFLL